MTVRLGYLVPEFPGQTHIMFWREIQQLEQRGVEVDLVSTRRPQARLQAHAWSQEAARRTTYLLPLTGAGLLRAARRGLAAGPTGWIRVAGEVLGSQRRLPGRVALLPAALVGAELAQLGRARGWTHLHVHSCASAADAARFARLLGGVPYSLTLHGPLSDYGPDQPAKWRRAAAAVVITRKLRAEVEQALAADLPPRVAVCGMGVQAARLERPEPYRPWLGEGPARIFSCGRLNPAKGHLDLLEAVRLLVDEGLPVTCAIAGEDEAGGAGYRRTLQDRIQELDLAGVVELLGPVPEEEVNRRLHEAHVFALASLEEPLGVAIMEAMAAGTPVVVTGAGGVPELVSDGQDGVLVPPQDPKTLSVAVARVLQDPSLASRLSVAGSRSARQRSAEPSSAEVLLGLIG